MNGDSTATVSGGVLTRIATRDNAAVNITGGAIDTAPFGNLSADSAAQDNSRWTLGGTGSVARVSFTDDSRFTMAGGTVNTLFVSDRATANIQSGGVGKIQIFDGLSTVNISGGTVGTTGSVTALNGTVNISGGQIGIFNSSLLSVLSLQGDSIGNITGGAITVIKTQDNAAVNISGGTADTLPFGVVTSSAAKNNRRWTISGTGSVARVEFIDTSHLTMTGGTVGSVNLRDKSDLTLRGGSIGSLLAQEFSSVSITAGDIDAVTLTGNSLAVLYGGHIGTVKHFDNAKFYWLGGTVDNHTIYALGDTLTSLTAASYILGAGVADNYTDAGTGLTYYGFFHPLDVTFGDGSQVSTRYFEALSDNSGTQYHPQFTFSAAPAAAGAPEAPSLVLCLTGVVLFGVGRGRRGKRTPSLVSHGKGSLLGKLSV